MQNHEPTQILRSQVLLIESCLCGASNAPPPSVRSSLLGEVILSSEELFLLVASRYLRKESHLISSDASHLAAQRLLEASFQLPYSVRP